MILTHRPLQMPWGQPVTEARRSRYTFKANWSATLDLLDRELWHLDASSVVLQVDVTEADLRLDGQLRANARPDFPGVRLIVDSPRGTLSWYRRALAKTHPDRLGGMRSRWDAVEAAGKLLGLAG